MSKHVNFGRGNWLVATVSGLVVATATTGLRAQFPTPEPTDAHKVLRKDVGVWDAEIKMWMGGPDSEPMVSKGMERNRLLGGLWLVSNFSGKFGDQEFQGHGVTGYDPTKKKYVGTWVDTMSTHISHTESTYDAAKSEMTMMMTGIDSQSGQEMTSKATVKYIDNDQHVMTMYMKDPAGDGDWIKGMEISYKRRPRDARQSKR